MTIKVSTTPYFDKLAKELRKRYPNVWKDIEPLIDELESGALSGDRLQRIGDYEAYKVRLSIKMRNVGRAAATA
jgi:hypothetical protein